MTEQEYRKCEPLYDQLRKEIPLMSPITTLGVQRRYRLGYNRASRMLEHLAKVGVLRCDNSGAYSPPDQTTEPKP